MSQLFRREAVERRRQRLLGDVVVENERSGAWFSALALLVLVASTIIVLFGHYSRTEQVIGVVTTETPPIKVFATRLGVLDRMLVAEGDYVKAGQSLAYVQVDRLDQGHRGIAMQRMQSLEVQSQLLGQKSKVIAESNAAETKATLIK